MIALLINFTNAKALLFGSLFFLEKDEMIFKKSIRIINDQIKEQVLNDGAHFELSTMYHSIFLEDILDMLKNLKKRYKTIGNFYLIKNFSKTLKIFLSNE